MLTANSSELICVKEQIGKGLKGIVGMTRDVAILHSLKRSDENFSPSVVVIAMPMTMAVARAATRKELVTRWGSASSAGQ